MIPHKQLEPVASVDIIHPEILHRIFGFLIHDTQQDGRPATHVDSIRSVRLTCRCFCDLATPLLIPEITVSMTEASLERLKNVSSNQLISRGVRSVNVKLSCYDRQMAANLHLFAYFHINSMASHRAYIKTAMHSQDSPMNSLYVMPGWIDVDVPKLCTEMLISWGRVRDGDPDVPEQEPDEYIEYRNILRDAHRDYQVLFQAQEKMREDGTFLSNIASAMAKMPSANELVITDGEDVENYFLIDRDYRTSMRAAMLAPHTWREPSSLTKPDFKPPTEFLHRLPTEIHKAGTTLQTMKIQCTGLWSYAKLSMSPSEITSLIESIQDLKTLTFDACVRQRGTDWQFKHIEYDFLPTLVQPSSLERLTVTFSKFTLAKSSDILSGAHPKCIKQLCLTGVTFGAGELGQYMVHIQGPCDVVLKDAQLCGGQWAEEVDVLRGLLRVSITFSGLRGAEFLDQEFQEKWNPWGERELNRYIQRATSVNPINKILYDLSNPSPVD